MKKIINFMANHCSKEEFIDMIKDTDACPGFFSLIGDPTECINKKGCERCWEYALKDIKFLEEEETEVIYQIGDNKIYTAIDNKLTEKSEKPKKEKKYSFLDIERLEAELKRINASGSIAGIEMVEKMLKEVKNDANRGKN